MNEHATASRPLDQARWLPRHVARRACRAEYRAWRHAALKPCRLAAAATAVAVGAVGSIAAAYEAAPGAAAAASPAAFVQAGAGSAIIRPAGPVPTAKRSPHRAGPAATMPPASRTVTNVPLSFALPGHARNLKPGANTQHPAATRRAVRHAIAPEAPLPARPYLIYDSVIPAAIPAGQSVATYADGPYAAAPAAVAGRGQVLWIDVYGSDPRADALDVEPGDATPAGAAAWVSAKLTMNPHSVAIIYTMRSWWPSLIADLGTLPRWMRSHVRYWIADPTGYPHILPGASATQWYWGPTYDITLASPGFWR